MILSMAAGLILTAFLASLFLLDNLEIQSTRVDAEFSIIQNSICREIESADAPAGVLEEYTFILDDTLSNDTHLAFYTVHQYVKVYLEGQLVYSLKPSKDQRLIKTVGSNWTMIPLYREDAGKEVRVEITPVYGSVRGREVEFLVGSTLDIYTDRLSQDLPQLVLSMITIIVGVIFLGIALFNVFKHQFGEGLAYLGLFSIMMGLWRLTDTRFTPFMFPYHPAFLFYLSVSVMMLGIIPLIRSMESRFHSTSRNIFHVYCMVTAVVCLIQLLLQFAGVMDLRENLLATHVVIGAGAILIIGNVVFEWIKYPEIHTRHVEIRIPVICVVGVLADLITYYIRGTSSGLLFSLLAFLIYILYSGISLMFHYEEQEKELMEKDRMLAENERKLAESRIATMISQIQPHFIYNTLGTIGQFCLEDPEKAADLVQKFSLYLRGNFTELDNAAPIRISKEIEHVRYYVDIEQIRFPDMQVVYDLKASDFMLPALTVQPLVENAIKHGLMGLESGGTVLVSTYETEDAFCVRIQDNGVGFDTENMRNDGRHIGIKNIRERIEIMCQGTLNIESKPGAGTTAWIRIPRKGVK